MSGPQTETALTAALALSTVSASMLAVPRRPPNYHARLSKGDAVITISSGTELDKQFLEDRP